MNRARLSRRIFRNALKPTLARYSKGSPTVRSDYDQIKAESDRLNEWRRQQIASWTPC
jgi:hypothetical protein